jgi:hypothetical protein
MTPEAPHMNTLPIKVKVVPNKWSNPNFIGFSRNSFTAFTHDKQKGSEEITT